MSLIDKATPAETPGIVWPLTVIVPCFNEEEVLREMHARLKKVCDALALPRYEILLVNDGSRDATWSIMCELAAADPHVVAVNLARNHGHQLALSAGLEVSRGERILVIDSDLQDPPELLPEMMRLMDEGADVVYGQRRKRAGESVFKRLTAAAFYRLIDRLSETRIPQDVGDFRLMSRRVADVLRRMPERHRFIRGMVSWIGYKQVPLLYDRHARFAGETKYPLIKMLRFAADAITSFSIKPLMAAAWLGFFASFSSIGFLAYALISWAFFQTTPGWTSLLALISLFSGMQMLVLGVMGAYLGRLYQQAQGRPLFLIESIVSAASENRPSGQGVLSRVP